PATPNDTVDTVPSSLEESASDFELAGQWLSRHWSLTLDAFELASAPVTPPASAPRPSSTNPATVRPLPPPDDESSVVGVSAGFRAGLAGSVGAACGVGVGVGAGAGEGPGAGVATGTGATTGAAPACAAESFSGAFFRSPSSNVMDISALKY